MDIGAVDLPRDLNLLVPLEALLVERHVTRAADRAGITQPAMSRALRRLRLTLQDELLVRDGGRYDLTPAGRDLLEKVQAVLPAVRAVFAPTTFDPATARTRFRIAGTDYPVSVLGPGLVRRLRAGAARCTLAFQPWHRRLGEDLASGAVDAMVVALAPPSDLRSEPVLQEEMVCVVDEHHPLAASRRVALEDYLASKHLSITTEGSDQASVDGTLAAAGRRRDVVVRAPTHAAGIDLVRGTDLVATLPSRSLTAVGATSGLRLLEAPPTLREITVLLVWHPRSDLDDAQRWLRQQVREVAAALAPAGRSAADGRITG